MVDGINKERDLNFDYTSLIWKLTEKVEELGGNPDKYREKLTEISK